MEYIRRSGETVLKTRGKKTFHFCDCNFLTGSCLPSFGILHKIFSLFRQQNHSKMLSRYLVIKKTESELFTSSHRNVLQNGGLTRWEGNSNEIEKNSSNHWSKMLELVWDCNLCRKRAESLRPGQASAILDWVALYDMTFWWQLLEKAQNLSQCLEKPIKN